MSGEITVVRNDVGYDLSFTITKIDGLPFDLTGYTNVKFKMALPEGESCAIIGDCVVTDAPNGKCKYTIVTDDMDTVGNYLGEIQIGFTGGKTITATGLTIKVTADLPDT